MNTGKKNHTSMPTHKHDECHRERLLITGRLSLTDRSVSPPHSPKFMFKL